MGGCKTCGGWGIVPHAYDESGDGDPCPDCAGPKPTSGPEWWFADGRLQLRSLVVPEGSAIRESVWASKATEPLWRAVLRPELERTK